jgi:hypothetical protein
MLIAHHLPHHFLLVISGVAKVQVQQLQLAVRAPNLILHLSLGLLDLLNFKITTAWFPQWMKNLMNTTVFLQQIFSLEVRFSPYTKQIFEV